MKVLIKSEVGEVRETRRIKKNEVVRGEDKQRNRGSQVRLGEEEHGENEEGREAGASTEAAHGGEALTADPCPPLPPPPGIPASLSPTGLSPQPISTPLPELSPPARGLGNCGSRGSAKHRNYSREITCALLPRSAGVRSPPFP